MPLFHYQLKEYNNINLKELTRFAPAWAQNMERIPVPHPTSTTTWRQTIIKGEKRGTM
jgi:hypothetical protein